MTEKRASDPWFSDELERAIVAAVNPLREDIRALKQLPANTAAHQTRIDQLEKSVNHLGSILKTTTVFSIIAAYTALNGDKKKLGEIFDLFEDSEDTGDKLFLSMRDIVLRYGEDS